MASANVSRGESADEALSLDDNFSLVTGKAWSGQVASASGSGAQRDPRPSSEGSEKAGLPANYKIPKTGRSRKSQSWSDSELDVAIHGLSESDAPRHVSDHSRSTQNSDSSSSDESSLPVKRRKKVKGTSRKKRTTDSSNLESSSSESETGRKRFDPFVKEKKKELCLTPSQEKFLKKHFGELHKEEVMAKGIHKPYSVPKTKSEVLKAQDLDSEVVDLLSDRDQRSVKNEDHSLGRVQKKLIKVFGPLGKLWSRVEDAVLNKSKLPDPDKILDYIKKSIILWAKPIQWLRLIDGKQS